jgi:hypothetical protein
MLRTDVEAILQRCGKDTWDLILVDPEGNWTRWVFVTKEQAEEACRDMRIPMHEAWDARLSQRFNRRDHWNQPGGQRRAL